LGQPELLTKALKYSCCTSKEGIAIVALKIIAAETEGAIVFSLEEGLFKMLIKGSKHYFYQKNYWCP